jgi:hypothetical protein
VQPTHSELLQDVSVEAKDRQVFIPRSTYTTHICIEGLAEVWQFQLIGDSSLPLSLRPDDET